MKRSNRCTLTADVVAELTKKGVKVSPLLVRAIITETIGAITARVENLDPVSLRGFGLFEFKQRAARIARNPKANEEVYVPAHTAICFKPSRSLRMTVIRRAAIPTL